MKIREQYHRILTAKNEWVKRINAPDEAYIPATHCSKDLIKSLTERYTDWEVLEEYHCCYGWETTCWFDVNREGVWDLSKKAVEDILVGFLDECRDMSSRKPIFYIYENEETVSILITYRHRPDHMNMDIVITGWREGCNESI